MSGAPSLLRSFAAFTVVLGVCAWPWLRGATHAAPCGHLVVAADQWLIVWILGWVAHALATAPLHLLDANINYPAPAQLTGVEHFLSTQLAFAPVFWLTGNAVLAANVAALLSYPLAALAMERLLLALGCARAVAWIGGLLFALGPERVPASIFVLKHPHLYLPLVALALTRLREVPTPRRAALLALATGLALFSSYYLAVAVLLAGGIWGLFELAAPGRGRGRFALLALAGAGAPLAALVVCSLPWYARPELSRVEFPSPGINLFVAGLHIAASGRVPLALAAAGVIALALGPRSASEAARRGLALTMIAQLLMIGPALPVGGDLVPMPFALVAASPARFFRYPFRFVVVLGFGTALLGSALLETGGRRLGRGAPVALAGVAALLLWSRAAGLVGDCREEFAAQRAPIYAAVREAAERDGAGPLLELPPIAPLGDPGGRGTEVQAMLGSTRHWLPLVGGYLDYPPPHRETLAWALSRLPASDALDDVVAMTHVRWLLLRPPGDWPPFARATRDALPALPGVRTVLEQDGWRLLALEREPAHGEWFAAIAAGWRPGRTTLGTPVLPLPEAAAVARVEAVGVGETVRAKGTLVLDLRVSNAGGATWPVAAPPSVPRTHLVGLVARWRRAGDDAARVIGSQAVPLWRDVPAGERLQEQVLLVPPPEPGSYTLEVGVRQWSGARFEGGRSAPLRLRVERVADATP